MLTGSLCYLPFDTTVDTLCISWWTNAGFSRRIICLEVRGMLNLRSDHLVLQSCCTGQWYQKQQLAVLTTWYTRLVLAVLHFCQASVINLKWFKLCFPHCSRGWTSSQKLMYYSFSSPVHAFCSFLCWVVISSPSFFFFLSSFLFIY